MPLAVFKDINQARQIVLEQLAAGDSRPDSSQHAGIGGCVDDPIDFGQSLKIAGGANVAVGELHAELAQAGPVRL